MKLNDIKAKLGFVFYGENSGRVHAAYTSEGNIIVFFDPHGMSASLFRKYFNNLIAILQIPFFLEIAHGFNHGTVLKSIVWEYAGDRLESRQLLDGNPGCTRLMFAGQPVFA